MKEIKIIPPDLKSLELELFGITDIDEILKLANKCYSEWFKENEEYFDTKYVLTGHKDKSLSIKYVVSYNRETKINDILK